MDYINARHQPPKEIALLESFLHIADVICMDSH